MAGRTLHPAVEEAIALHRAAVDRVMLRTIYINPTFATNGDGSTWTQAASNGAPGACNAWGTGTYGGTFDQTHFWRDRTRYLQCAETQVNNIVVYATDGSPMQGIVIGTYDPATGAQIRDGTRHARVWSTSGKALDTNTAATNRQNITVDNMDCRALARTVPSGQNYGVSNYASEINVYAGVTLIRCIADGYVAITMKGAGMNVYGCDFNGYSDALTLQTTSAQVLGNKLFDPFLQIDPATYDSCTIEVIGNYTATLIRIEHNDFRKPIRSDKQCVYLSCQGATNVNTPTGPVTVRYNKLSHANQQIYSALDNTEVAYNWIDNSYKPDDMNGTGAGDPRIVTIIANNAYIHDNLATNSPFATGVNISATSGTTRAHRNTFDGMERVITATTGTHTIDWRDNISVRSPQTVQPDTDCLYIKTVSSITLNASGNLYYGAADPANAFFIASTYKNFSAYKSDNEPTAQFAVPGYDAQHIPTPGGNLAGLAGTGGGYDINGRAREYPTSIGAFEQVRPRPSRTLP